MDSTDFLMLTSKFGPAGLGVDDLSSEWRTLLFGYDCQRRTHHVYLRGALIHLLVTTRSSEKLLVHEHQALRSWPTPQDRVPDKRVYPESTDYDFAVELRARGVEIPFLPFDEKRYAGVKKLGAFHDGLCPGYGGCFVRPDDH